jgi:hypothetical protein
MLDARFSMLDPLLDTRYSAKPAQRDAHAVMIVPTVA